MSFNIHKARQIVHNRHAFFVLLKKEFEFSYKYLNLILNKNANIY